MDVPTGNENLQGTDELGVGCVESVDITWTCRQKMDVLTGDGFVDRRWMYRQEPSIYY